MQRAVWLLAAVIVGYPLHSEAKLLEVWLSGQGGGVMGLYSHPSITWTDGEEHKLENETDYYMVHSGPAYGVAGGIEFFFIDLQAEFFQITDSAGNPSSQLLNLMLGLDVDLDYGPVVWTPFLTVGLGLGTANSDWMKEENPQLTREDLDSQILFARVGGRLEYRLLSFMRLSLEAGVAGHFIQKAYLPANAEESKSVGAHGYVMGGLRFVFDILGGGHEEVNRPEPAPKPTVIPPRKVTDRQTVQPAAGK